MVSEQFWLALRRFVARPRKPNEIISDNAPHFQVTKNTIHTCLDNERIKRSFIIELSPWMGGFL